MVTKKGVMSFVTDIRAIIGMYIAMAGLCAVILVKAEVVVGDLAEKKIDEKILDSESRLLYKMETKFENLIEVLSIADPKVKEAVIYIDKKKKENQQFKSILE